MTTRRAVECLLELTLVLIYLCLLVKMLLYCQPDRIIVTLCRENLREDKEEESFSSLFVLNIYEACINLRRESLFVLLLIV